MTPRRRWGNSTDASAAMTAHRPVIQDTQKWRYRLTCPFLVLSSHGLGGLTLRRLPSTVPCSTMIFGSVSRRQTWLTLDGWQYRLLTSGEDTDLLPYIFVCFVLSAWHAKHSPVAYVFKGLDSTLQIQISDKWLVDFNVCRKTDSVVFPKPNQTNPTQPSTQPNQTQPKSVTPRRRWGILTDDNYIIILTIISLSGGSPLGP